MIAEVIEKGDAMFTVKYKAENGQEALLITMMSMGIDSTGYLMAGPDTVTIPSVRIPVLTALSKKWEQAK